MPTALTGSIGWTGLHPTQLGGPPLTNTYVRSLPSVASPMIAHVYQNDAVTFLGSFAVMNAPTLINTTANGSFDQVQLEVASRTFTIAQGNVVRLTFQDDGSSIVYSGVVEDLPDVIGPTQVQHLVLVSPFGFELDDVHSQSNYTASVDIVQIVRDAVDQTLHCSCDQISVPPSTGIVAPGLVGASLDFRHQTLKSQIDLCRSLAGPAWYWHVDELGRVWFQFMASAATYTLVRGQHYEERTSAASIQDRKNHIVVVGGLSTGGSQNVTAVYDGSSQATIGVRALVPDVSLPHISDLHSVQNVATSLGGVLDRVWNRVQLKVHQPFNQRIHSAQPGGGMVRYWEPSVNAMTESETGSGGYTGPYIAQRVEYDGEHQQVTAGDIPVTSQNDVQNMVNNIVQYHSSHTYFITPGALNLSQQVFTGSLQSGTGTVASSGAPATLWQLNQQEFVAIDPTGIVRAEMGNLPVRGVSAAQWGFRATDASGTPIFDSLGVLGIPKRLAEVIQTTAVQGTNTSFADVSGAVTPTFTLSRASNVLVMAMGRIAAQAAGSGNVVFLGLRCGSDTTTGAPIEADAIATDNFMPYCLFFWDTLAAGSYTAALQAQTSLTGANHWNVAYADVIVFQFGG
jgi:hypothetical protein